MSQKNKKLVASVSEDTHQAWRSLCSDTGMALPALMDVGPAALRKALANIISMRKQRTPETAEATESPA